MSIYKKSYISKAVVIKRAVNTSTIMAAYGSGDNFTAPFDLFGDDETIRVAGNVVATDGADLSAGRLEITVNGGPIQLAPLIFAGGVNTFSLDLGILAEGNYTVIAQFLRLRKTPWMGPGVEIIYEDEYQPSRATITIGARGVAGVGRRMPYSNMEPYDFTE